MGIVKPKHIISENSRATFIVSRKSSKSPRGSQGENFGNFFGDFPFEQIFNRNVLVL